MAYTVINFKTKKALKEAVKLDQNTQHLKLNRGIRCYNPGLGPDLSNYTGKVALEGPHYPKPHSWYASAELKDGIVIKVS
jgi:hypothetical protein